MTRKFYLYLFSSICLDIKGCTPNILWTIGLVSRVTISNTTRIDIHISLLGSRLNSTILKFRDIRNDDSDVQNLTGVTEKIGYLTHFKLWIKCVGNAKSIYIVQIYAVNNVTNATYVHRCRCRLPATNVTQPPQPVLLPVEIVCPQKTFGRYCRHRCNCKGDGDCDSTGKCDNGCKDGHTGPNCLLAIREACPRSQFFNGSTCLPCNCDGGACPPDGECMSCSHGFTGKTCQEVCSPGTFGRNCYGTCNCKNKEPCDPVHGVCDAGCAGGFEGIGCQEEIINNTDPDEKANGFPFIAYVGIVFAGVLIAGIVIIFVYFRKTERRMYPEIGTKLDDEENESYFHHECSQSVSFGSDGGPHSCDIAKSRSVTFATKHIMGNYDKRQDVRTHNKTRLLLHLKSLQDGGGYEAGKPILRQRIVHPIDILNIKKRFKRAMSYQCKNTYDAKSFLPTERMLKRCSYDETTSRFAKLRRSSLTDLITQRCGFRFSGELRKHATRHFKLSPLTPIAPRRSISTPCSMNTLTSYEMIPLRPAMSAITEGGHCLDDLKRGLMNFKSYDDEHDSDESTYTDTGTFTSFNSESHSHYSCIQPRRDSIAVTKLHLLKKDTDINPPRKSYKQRLASVKMFFQKLASFRRKDTDSDSDHEHAYYRKHRHRRREYEENVKHEYTKKEHKETVDEKQNNMAVTEIIPQVVLPTCKIVELGVSSKIDDTSCVPSDVKSIADSEEFADALDTPLPHSHLQNVIVDLSPIAEGSKEQPDILKMHHSNNQHHSKTKGIGKQSSKIITNVNLHNQSIPITPESTADPHKLTVDLQLKQHKPNSSYHKSSSNTKILSHKANSDEPVKDNPKKHFKRQNTLPSTLNERPKVYTDNFAASLDNAINAGKPVDDLTLPKPPEVVESPKPPEVVEPPKPPEVVDKPPKPPKVVDKPPKPSKNAGKKPKTDKKARRGSLPGDKKEKRKRSISTQGASSDTMIDHVNEDTKEPKNSNKPVGDKPLKAKNKGKSVDGKTTKHGKDKHDKPKNREKKPPGELP